MTAVHRRSAADAVYSAFPRYEEISIREIYGMMDPKQTERMVEQTIRTPGRQPSPQPTHIDVSGGGINGNTSNCHNGPNGHRILRSATVGYVAPTFEGKKAQMEDGELDSYIFS